MRIATAIFPFYATGHQTPRGSSKKQVLNLLKGSFSKAAAIFMHGAYDEYVSTEKWRERR